VLVVGPAAIAVMVFEIALNATSMFNHANASLPSGLDRVIRRFVVTPDMHRLHHSPEREETNANFGFNLPWWDRLFGTYRDQPKLGHDAMTIGLADVDGSKATGLGSILVQPFVGAPGRYPIGGQER
jgi:sterol desaturase/sphingolipid hydroxylase (fatty acid hydroxylase superfamily)